MRALYYYNCRDYDVSSELFQQFVNVIAEGDYEKKLWPELKKAYSCLSTVAMNSSNSDEAIYLLKRSLELTIKYEPSNFLSLFLTVFDIARNFYLINDYNDALDYYRQAEILSNSTSAVSTFHKAIVYNNLSLCYLKLGRDAEAQQLQEMSNRLNTSIKNHDNLANDYNNEGLVFQSKKEYEQALTYFNKSISLYDSLNNSGKVAFVTNNIGNLYLEKKCFDSSKLYYERSLELREIIKKDTLGLINSLNNLSYTNYKLNNIDSAIYFNEAAMELNYRVPKLGKPTSIFSVSDYLLSIADRLEINLQKYNATNDVSILNHSCALFEAAIHCIIDQLAKYRTLFTTDIFIGENRRIFDSAMQTALVLDSLHPLVMPRTLVVSEIIKSLSLLNISSELKNLKEDTIDEKWMDRANKKFRWQEFLLASDEDSTNASTIQLIDSLISVTIEEDSLRKLHLDQLNKNVHHYYVSLPDSLESGREKQGNSLLIDYYISDQTLFIHAITKDGIQCVQVPINELFIETINDYSRALRLLNRQSTIVLGNILSTYLLTPIEKTIRQYQNIIIVPDEKLIEIPFESLPFQFNKNQSSSYFIEHKDISYRFSILNRNYAQKAVFNDYTYDFFGIAPFDLDEDSQENLTGCAKEVTEISKLFLNRGRNAANYCGEEATYDNLIKESHLSSKFLHFSTHSHINEQYSHLSFLRLAADKNQCSLFLPTLSELPFQNDLLVLSACETGSNINSASTGCVSFIRSTSNISIRNYICTLWNIVDDPSYQFMLQFYKHILSGLDYKRSIALTKRSFIHNPSFNNPIFWSPFILYENN